MSEEARNLFTLIKIVSGKPALSEYTPAQVKRLVEAEVSLKESEVTKTDLVIEAFKQESTREHVSKTFAIFKEVCKETELDEAAHQIFKSRLLSLV